MDGIPKLSDTQLLGVVLVPLAAGLWIAFAVVLGSLLPCVSGAACYLPVLAALPALPVAAVVSFLLVRFLRPGSGE